jgi:hypothetical protein
VILTFVSLTNAFQALFQLFVSLTNVLQTLFRAFTSLTNAFLMLIFAFVKLLNTKKVVDKTLVKIKTPDRSKQDIVSYVYSIKVGWFLVTWMWT